MLSLKEAPVNSAQPGMDNLSKSIFRTATRAVQRIPENNGFCFALDPVEIMSIGALCQFFLILAKLPFRFCGKLLIRGRPGSRGAPSLSPADRPVDSRSTLQDRMA